MNEFHPISFSDETLRKYWEGSSNVFARYYTYLQRGFGLVNEAKNYFLLLFGAYWTIKTNEYWNSLGISDGVLIGSVGIGAIAGVLFLIHLGRWDLFKLSKAREFATIQHGTITQYNVYNMTVKLVQQNDKIIELLEKLNENREIPIKPKLL